VVVLLYTLIVTASFAARSTFAILIMLKPPDCVGLNPVHPLSRDLPRCVASSGSRSALRFSYAIFLIASLGFLGLGVQPPSPSWGRMVEESRGEYLQAPWSLWVPAAAIAILVIGVNLMADGLRRIFRYEGE
jgi:peptide/nickel transport system permease protein